MPPARHKIKLLVLGDAGVGKTSLIQRYVQNTFSSKGLPSTITYELAEKVIRSHDINVKLQIWDTPGKTLFHDQEHSLTPQSLRDCDGVIIVYDVTSRYTFEYLSYWIQKVDMYAPDSVRILVGNKCEPDIKREVEYIRARKYADDLGMNYMEVSVKIPQHVNEMFEVVAGRIVQKGELKPISENPITVKLKNKPRRQGQCC